MAVQADFPVTDYEFFRGYRSPEKRVEMLQQQVKELTERRDSISLVAKYLWMVLSAKENEMHVCKDQERKDVLQQFASVLNLLHVRKFTEMAHLTLMIANSAKIIKQVEDGVGDTSLNSELVKERLDKTQDELVAEVCPDVQARISATQAGLSWADEYGRSGLDEYYKLLDKYLEQARDQVRAARGGKQLSADEDHQLKKTIVEAMSKANVSHLADFNISLEIAQEAREELDELRRQNVNIDHGGPLLRGTCEFWACPAQINDSTTQVISSTSHKICLHFWGWENIIHAQTLWLSGRRLLH